MKKISIIVLALALILVTPVFAQNGGGVDYVASKGAEEKKPDVKPHCPKTLISDNDKCMTCHVIPDFRLKETRPDAHLDYPMRSKIIGWETGELKGYFRMAEIDFAESDIVLEFFRYLKRHGIEYAVIEIYSGGGSVFAGWRIKSLLDQWKEGGKIVETRVGGVAASAATMVFAAGSKGYRAINPQAELMFHELWTFKLFDFATPSDKEDEARILRHLQDTITAWLATRCKLSKEELDEKIKKKEFWINGQEAYELGFADKLIGNKDTKENKE